jgi:predicted SnoaL-like aldol condensation-catalyzing enzyme
MAATGNVKAAYEKYISPRFIHHNQHFKGDRQSLLSAMEEAHKLSPNKSIDIKQVIEEDNTVVTHSLVTRVKPEQPAIAVVHIFKFENNQVIELWDLGQEINNNSPNENGLF